MQENPTHRTPVIGAPGEPVSSRPASNGGAEPIDESELLKRWANNRQLCATLVRKFEAQIHNDLPRMEGAAGAGDTEQLAFLAHSLKGAAAYVAAVDIHRAAAAVEAAAKAGQSAKAVELCGRLCALLSEALPRLPAVADRVG